MKKNESAVLLCVCARLRERVRESATGLLYCPFCTFLSCLYVATLHCFGNANVQFFVMPIKHLNVNVRAHASIVMLCVSLVI